MEDCSIRYDDGINIMAVGSTWSFDLRVGKDGVVYDLVDVGSGLIFLRLFTITNHLPDVSVKYVGSRPMTDGKRVSVW